MAKMAVNIAGIKFKNPLITASGAYGFGREYENLYPLSLLGGIATKGTTLTERLGNPSPRIAETSAGILNAVGLQNPGISVFVEKELPYLASKNTGIVANVAGSTVEECVEAIRCLEDCAVDIIELNVSCPNVKAGGIAFGSSCSGVETITRAVRDVTSKPLMVKLSPNVTNIVDIAKAAEASGADAVSLINTLLGMRIDIQTRKPILKNNTGGLSGPAIFPIAVRMVWQVYQAVNIPIVGMGGISTWEDAVEMMLAGARAFQIGTVLFSDPLAPIHILDGIENFLDENGITDVNEIVGTVQPW